MSRQYWSETIAWATADGTAVNTTTTETIVFPNITIPANYLQDGRAIRINAYGRFGSTGTPTQTWRLRWGGVAGTVLAASGAITVGSGITAGIWNLSAVIQTRTNGSSGSVYCIGEIVLGEDAAPTQGTVTNYSCGSFMGSAGVATPAAVTVDLTADTALSLTVTHGTSNAANTVTGHIYTIEALN